MKSTVSSEVKTLSRNFIYKGSGAATTTPTSSPTNTPIPTPTTETPVATGSAVMNPTKTL
ncbi:hypothetical protein HGB07_04265 [Candidatus Roizmanbacteria bacterium]|nr:hypothetical protein [Candidatus Roizmanbacteria bacterium]